MAWKALRGRFGADALTEEEIQKLQVAPETAADHVARCNSCRSAAREQRATLEPLLRDLLHVALAHGHAITLRPNRDSYDTAIEIHPDRDRIPRTGAVRPVGDLPSAARLAARVNGGHG